MDFLSSPYRVTAPDGKVRLVVMNATEGLPAAFALMGTRAAKKVAIRVTGGCKNMTPQDKLDMLGYFSRAFSGYKGLIWSGGTRASKDGKVDPMVTDVPGVIAAENEGCVALGTLPRTDMLTLQGDSRLVLDEWGASVNPDCLGILIVQNGAEGKLDWDGDLDTYFSMMQNWQKFAGFTSLGLVSWNGGDFTRKEIVRSAQLGWPTILIKGSGRMTDEIINKLDMDPVAFLAENKILVKRPVFYIASKDSPVELTTIFRSEGFLD